MALDSRTNRPEDADDQPTQPSASKSPFTAPPSGANGLSASGGRTRFHHWESLRPQLHDLWGERSQAVSEALWASKAGTTEADETTEPAAGARFEHWQHLRHRRALGAHEHPSAKITRPLEARPTPAAPPQQPAPERQPKATKPISKATKPGPKATKPIPKSTKPVPAGEPVLSLQLLPVRVSLPAVIDEESQEITLDVPPERALIVPETPERAVRKVTPPGLPAAGAPLPGRPYTRAQVLRRHWKRDRLHASALRHRRQQRRVGIGMAASILVPSALAMLVLLSLAGIALLYFSYEQAQVSDLAAELPKDSLKVYDSQGDLIFELADQGSQTTVSLDQISLDAINATTAIEDKDFWQNQGVDFIAVVRAATDDLRNGQVVSGASTITQQLIKNALVGPAPTFDRKLREMILALGTTQEYSKQQILTFYLNTIYYGEQAYGIDAAAHTYFNLTDSSRGRAASKLDLAQAAMLAGLPRAPSQYDPADPNNFQQALDRQKTVLQQMVVAGYITSADAVLAEQEAARPGFIHLGHATNVIPSVSNFVLRELQQLMDSGQIPPSILSRSGLQVETSLNMTLQNQMLKIAQAHIKAKKANHMSDAAVTMIDYHTGAIEVLIGSINPNSQFDVAAQGYRQPGSSFKPFVYATAFEKGWSPGTAISDSPVHIFISAGEPIYSPVNYDHRFHGEITLRYALQNSFNVPAVKTELFAGIKQSLATAEDMGITTYLGTPAPSMVLGGLSVHLLDETSAYGVFADGGVRMAPHIIQEIRDSQGNLIYAPPTTGQQIISPQVAGLVTNVLSDDKERQYEFGVCSPLMLYNGTPYSAACKSNPGVVRPAAAKTGTTQDFKDNWTVGYTSDYVIGVWAGNDNGDPMVNVSGVDGAAPIWHDSMLLAERGHPIVPFALPHGLVRATVHYPDGVTSTDWYLPGTVPAGGVIVGYS
jgi:membrane peptidoglycan carboxypeptidase